MCGASLHNRILLDKIPRRYVYPWLIFTPVRSEGEDSSALPLSTNRNCSLPIDCSNDIKCVMNHAFTLLHPNFQGVNIPSTPSTYAFINPCGEDTSRGYHLEDPPQ